IGFSVCLFFPLSVFPVRPWFHLFRDAGRTSAIATDASRTLNYFLKHVLCFSVDRFLCLSVFSSLCVPCAPRGFTHPATLEGLPLSLQTLPGRLNQPKKKAAVTEQVFELNLIAIAAFMEQIFCLAAGSFLSVGF
ncbi:MAG: hypothetical protein WD137_05265, partial [Balneolaceae bacterium]